MHAVIELAESMEGKKSKVSQPRSSLHHIMEVRKKYLKVPNAHLSVTKNFLVLGVTQDIQLVGILKRP